LEFIINWLTFSFDFALLLPPLGAIKSYGISPANIKIFFFLSLFLLLIAIVYWSSSSMLGENKSTAFLIGLCVCVLGIVGLKKSVGNINDLTTLFSVSWFPLVLTMRFFEGMSLGHLFRKKIGVWIPLALLIPMVGSAYVLLADLTEDKIAYIKAVLLVLGAFIASFYLIKQLKSAQKEEKSGIEFVGVSIFLTFCSASLYVATDNKLGVIYTYLFPAGILFGLLFGHKMKENVN
jgi:hypothetical protein